MKEKLQQSQKRENLNDLQKMHTISKGEVYMKIKCLLDSLLLNAQWQFWKLYMIESQKWLNQNYIFMWSSDLQTILEFFMLSVVLEKFLFITPSISCVTASRWKYMKYKDWAKSEFERCLIY